MNNRYVHIIAYILCCIFLHLFASSMHIFEYFCIFSTAYFCIFRHISCIFLIAYFGLLLNYIYMHTNTYFSYFRYFAYFAYMDVSWAHSVLQLCAEKTLSKLSVLILGKGFGWYYLFSSDFSQHTAAASVFFARVSISMSQALVNFCRSGMLCELEPPAPVQMGGGGSCLNCRFTCSASVLCETYRSLPTVSR